MKQKIIYCLISLIGLALGLAILIFKPLDTDNFEDSDYYKKTSSNIEDLDVSQFEAEDIEIGWASINFTPDRKSKLAGYGPREIYTAVDDSSYASCIFIRSPKGNFLILNYDLLVIHHTFTDAIESTLRKYPELDIKGIYYTCTHSHSSYGGWAKGILPKFSLGGYDANILNFMTKSTAKMVLEASLKTSPCEMGYIERSVAPYIKNRIDGGTNADNLVRLLVFKDNISGRKAGIITCAAHPTFNPKSTHTLKADYPKYTKDLVQKEFQLETTLFASGAVASSSFRTIIGCKPTPRKYGYLIADSLSKYKSTLNYKPITAFNFTNTLVEMPPAQFKLNNYVAVRSSVFDYIFGKPEAKIGIMQFNKNALFGISGEISGETMKDIRKNLTDKSINYIPTSFNGDYIGYLTHPSHYYSREHTETRDLNFYGPHNTAYFIEISKHFLNHLNKQSNTELH